MKADDSIRVLIRIPVSRVWKPVSVLWKVWYENVMECVEKESTEELEKVSSGEKDPGNGHEHQYSVCADGLRFGKTCRI